MKRVNFDIKIMETSFDFKCRDHVTSEINLPRRSKKMDEISLASRIVAKSLNSEAGI